MTRNLLIALGIVAVTFAVLVAAEILVGIFSHGQKDSGVAINTGPLRGMFVTTIDGADFPSSPDLSSDEMKAELDEMTAFAAAYGFNSIFFEAVPDCTAFYRSSELPRSSVVSGGLSGFDPLGYLTDSAKKQGLSVYAVINPLRLPSGNTGNDFPANEHSEWVLCERLKPDIEGVQKLVGKVTAELTRGYDIAGVLLKGLDDGVPVVPEAAGTLVVAASGAVKHKDTQRFGVLLGSTDGLALLSDGIGSDSGVDMVVVTDGGAVVGENGADDENDADSVDAVEMGAVSEIDASDARLLEWKNAAENIGAAYYTLHMTGDADAASHILDDKLFVETKSGVSGTVIGRYGTLNTETRAAAISIAASFVQTPPASLPDGWDAELRTFSVTRPTEEITVDTSWETYFITGTSDPALPVTCDGQALAQSNEIGLWGVQVEVKYGVNTYNIAQGDSSVEVVIRRNKPSSGSPAPISDIVASSAYPPNAEAVLNGQKLKLSCKAPSGGSMTATVGGEQFELTQVAETSGDGVPALYQASADISALTVSGEVKNLGAIEYSLTYEGNTTSATSAGEVFAAGDGASPVASIKTFIAPVNKNAADDGVYDTILKRGCVDIITENLGGYYRLSSGGYLLKDAVNILEGETDRLIRNTVTTASVAPVAKGETIILGGTARPAFRAGLADGTLSVQLFSTEFSGVELASLKGELIESVSSEDNADGSVTVSVTLGDARMLGWDVRFDENNTVINLRRMPEIHLDTAKPLSDVTVVLDPGHGGDDPGAMGIPALSGPTESILNLASSKAVQSRLEALGATVYLAHNDENMTLNDRMEFSEKQDADFFISNHHNSLGLTADANTAAGIEVYYYNDQSAAFAENIGENLSAATGRKLRFVNQSWYRVTMMTDCPSVLVESGYLCNPKEYEAIASDRSMLKYGSAVADAVMNYLA